MRLPYGTANQQRWLADLIRGATDIAEEDVSDPSEGRWAFVVGYLMSHADLTDTEQTNLLRRIGARSLSPTHLSHSRGVPSPTPPRRLR